MLAAVASGSISTAIGGNSLATAQNASVGMGIAKNAVENNLLSKQDDDLVYHLSEKLRKVGSLTKAEQDLLASRLLRDSVVDNLLLAYQEEPNKLSDEQKKTLIDEIHRIASSYGISADVLFKTDLKNTIKRDDKNIINYLNQSNNFQTQFMYSSQDAWATAPVFGAGINIAGKAINVAPKLLATAEKYPLLTEMGVTAITNTAYQLTNKDTYDPYDLLKAEMSTVLTRDQPLSKQLSLNLGIDLLATTSDSEYGINTISSLVGTTSSHYFGNVKTGNKYINTLTTPIMSNILSKYISDSDRLHNYWNKYRKELEGVYNEK